jgi:hypothetical protein
VDAAAAVVVTAFVDAAAVVKLAACVVVDAAAVEVAALEVVTAPVLTAAAILLPDVLAIAEVDAVVVPSVEALVDDVPVVVCATEDVRLVKLDPPAVTAVVDVVDACAVLRPIDKASDDKDVIVACEVVVVELEDTPCVDEPRVVVVELPEVAATAANCVLATFVVLATEVVKALAVETAEVEAVLVEDVADVDVDAVDPEVAAAVDAITEVLELKLADNNRVVTNALLLSSFFIQIPSLHKSLLQSV